MEKKIFDIASRIPEGYEIDRENSTFERIVLKPITKKLPESIDDYIDNFCSNLGRHHNAFKVTAFKDRTNGIYFLRPLLKIMDMYNEGWKPDWTDRNQEKWSISCDGERFNIRKARDMHTFTFKSEELAEKFFKAFRSDINAVTGADLL